MLRGLRGAFSISDSFFRKFPNAILYAIVALVMPEPIIALRPESDADAEFVSRLYADGRRTEIEQFGWDELTAANFLAMQCAFREKAYRLQFGQLDRDIVLADEVEAGRLLVKRGRGSISIVDIALLTHFQGRGIGTKLVRDLQMEAAKLGVALRLRVGLANTSATRLYSRLGFKRIDISDSDELLEWRSGT